MSSYPSQHLLTKTIIGSNNTKFNNNVKNRDKIKSESNEEKECNCRNRIECPLGGNCLTSDIVYKCEVITSNETEVYLGSTGTFFKDRYRNHLTSLNLDTEKENKAMKTTTM